MNKPACLTTNLTTIIAPILVGNLTAHSATLAQFTNDATNGTSSFADEAAAANVTVSDLSFGGTPIGTRTSDGPFSTYVGTGLAFLASDVTSNANLNSSDAADRFAVFSITAAPNGCAINFL